ncbi:hypothetical protein DITRI_Ditri18aG0073100 [Diplodiscus trichospermus]
MQRHRWLALHWLDGHQWLNHSGILIVSSNIIHLNGFLFAKILLFLQYSSKPVDGGKISRVIGNADGARTTLSVAAFNLRERLVNSRAFSTYPSCGKLNKISEKRNLGDHKRRLLAAKYEMRRKLYKSFCKDPNLPSGLRDIHRYKLSKLPRNSSFTRVRNRCIFTGRSRAIYQFFRVSRIVFRELASRGALMGVKKASW